jgi:hypothetical protein
MMPAGKVNDESRGSPALAQLGTLGREPAMVQIAPTWRVENTMLCVYRGPARAGSEYVGDIAVYVAEHGNDKTGKVAGLIVAPVVAGKVVGYWQARKTGADRCVCGNCQHRSKASGGNGTCYVGNGSQVGMGLDARLRKADALTPEPADLAGYLRTLRRGGASALRSAVWGDAGALPVDVWQTIESAATDARLPVLGYTHAALDGVPHLRASHVASVDGEAYTPDGWRSFRVADPGAKPRAGEFACPASAERGHVTTCGTCLACGTVGNAQDRRSVVIWRHDMAGQVAARRLRDLTISVR